MVKFGAEQRSLLATATLSSRAPALWAANGVDERVFVRGSPKTLGDIVPRRFLEALPTRMERPRATTTAGSNWPAASPTRLAIRSWPASPLTASGTTYSAGGSSPRSITSASSATGRPTWNCSIGWPTDFVRRGWSTQRLIRSLVLTRTYQMSSTSRLGRG